MDTTQTNRPEDSRLEQIVNEFLDKHFFTNPNFHFENVQWVTDKETQLKGVDITFTQKKYNLENVKVDIKAAVRYTTKYLSTYALECTFLNKEGKERIGWLIDENKETEYYLLVYPRSKKFYTEITSVEDIDYVDLYLVSREKILNFLNEEGYNKTEIDKISAQLREEYNGEGRGLAYETSNWQYFFYISGELAEKPVNVVIKRSLYDRIALYKKTITKQMPKK